MQAIATNMEVVLRKQAFQIIKMAVRAVQPANLFAGRISLTDALLKINDQQYNLNDFRSVYVLGAGKGAAHMAQALEEVLGDRIEGGFVITKYRHKVDCKRIQVAEAGHPVSDLNGLNATRELLEMAATAGEDDLVIFLLSGGASALMEFLPHGIGLPDLQSLTQIMLQCGASITEINIIRKHISRVKGGRLARIIYPASCVTLIISDVIGDDLSAIGSGPTVADPSSFADAWKIVEKYHLSGRLPAMVQQHLQAGLKGETAETPKEGDSELLRTSNIILGNNVLALTAAEEAATKIGYNCLTMTSQLQGEARRTAATVVKRIREVMESDTLISKPACLLFAGETTVTVRGSGKGGRNQEFVLAALCDMIDISRSYTLLSFGTDGTDGPTDAAGAIISPQSIVRAQDVHINPRDFLQNNDAYHFFQQINGLISTGPTGTNVMDIGVVLIP